jgi:hypothetical protein
MSGRLSRTRPRAALSRWDEQVSYHEVAADLS